MLPVLIVLAVVMLMTVPVKGHTQILPWQLSERGSIDVASASPEALMHGVSLGVSASLSVDVVITSNLSEEVLIVKGS